MSSPDHLVRSIGPDAIDAIRALPGPLDRARAAEAAVAAANDLRGELARERRNAVRELRGPARPALRTWGEVAELLGVSAARAQTLADLPPDPTAPRGPRVRP